jgi:hypothetical protein
MFGLNAGDASETNIKQKQEMLAEIFKKVV